MVDRGRRRTRRRETVEEERQRGVRTGSFKCTGPDFLICYWVLIWAIDPLYLSVSLNDRSFSVKRSISFSSDKMVLYPNDRSQSIMRSIFLIVQKTVLSVTPNDRSHSEKRSIFSIQGPRFILIMAATDLFIFRIDRIIERVRSLYNITVEDKLSAQFMFVKQAISVM